MSEYRPDNWVLVKITGTDPHYRVFGSWRGGYAEGDSWRLNSGVTRVEEDENYFYFYGYTGSCYVCGKNSYGYLGSYNSGVITNYCDKSGGKMSIIADMPDVMKMDWIIS